MEREYDLFEMLPDGAPVWRGHARGLVDAEAKLRQIAESTDNECFALYLPTKETIIRLNASPLDSQASATVC
jgi:hypothetical protein